MKRQGPPMLRSCRRDLRKPYLEDPGNLVSGLVMWIIGDYFMATRCYKYTY